MSNLMKLLDDAANASRNEVWRPIDVTSESMALQAAIAALDAAGYVIVPVEPTAEMIDTAVNTKGQDGEILSDYMRRSLGNAIAAAPKVTK